MSLVEGLRIAQIQLGYLQIVFVVKTRHFIEDLNIHALIRLQANRQLVLRQLLPVLFKQVQLRGFKINHHFRTFGRQAFTGTQVERHAGPAPVIDIDADSHKGLGIAGFVRPLFFEVARDFFTLGEAGGVLAADRFLTYVGAVDTAQRLQHFDFFVTNAVGTEV